MTNAVIQLEDICFTYKEEEVLCSVTAQVNKGDFAGIIGPNGSGKTTLVKIMLGLISPDKGKVKLFGKDIKDFKDFNKIGYIGQKSAQITIPTPISVYEIVGLGLTGSDTLKNEKIIEALREVSLVEYKDSLISELSGGQQQRAFIAKALVASPELLILDEPTTGIDVNSQDNFYKLLADLNKKGITLIIISHDIDVIVNEVNKLLCLNKTLVYHGTPKEFIKEDYLERLYGKNRKFIIHDH